MPSVRLGSGRAPDRQPVLFRELTICLWEPKIWNSKNSKGCFHLLITGMFCYLLRLGGEVGRGVELGGCWPREGLHLTAPGTVRKGCTSLSHLQPPVSRAHKRVRIQVKKNILVSKPHLCHLWERLLPPGGGFDTDSLWALDSCPGTQDAALTLCDLYETEQPPAVISSYAPVPDLHLCDWT